MKPRKVQRLSDQYKMYHSEIHNIIKNIPNTPESMYCEIEEAMDKESRL